MLKRAYLYPKQEWREVRLAKPGVGKWYPESGATATWEVLLKNHSRDGDLLYFTDPFKKGSVGKFRATGGSGVICMVTQWPNLLKFDACNSDKDQNFRLVEME